MIKKIRLILFIIIPIFIGIINVDANTQKNLVNIYLIHSNTCSHCKEEIKFLNKLEKKYENIRIYKYEIREKQTNNILNKIEEIYNKKITGVPVVIIGNKLYEGYSEKSQLTIIKTIEYFSKYGYKDEMGEFLEKELPTFEIKNNNIELNEFIDNYKNYKLFGIKTDKLTPSNVAILLGILSIFNITTILIILLSIITLSKIKNIKTRIKVITIYIMINTITTLLSLNISNNKNITIFKDILNLHKLTGLNKISYYINYIFINFLITIIFIYITNLIVDKIKHIIKK